MKDDDDGGGDDADKLHQESCACKACELALAPFHRMWCRNVAKDEHRDTVVYVLQLMVHLK